MSRQRRFGMLFGVLAFVGICAGALFSTYDDNLFSGLPGIENSLESATSGRLAELSIDDALVQADGRELTVTLPSGLPEGRTIADIRQNLLAESGVRKLKLSVDESTDPSEPEPTAVPEPAPTAEPDPEPTAEPDPTPEPAPTAEPDHEPTAEPDSTPEPAGDPTPDSPDDGAITAAEVVALFDTGEIVFEPGTASLSEGALEELDELAGFLQGVQGGPIEVQAHTEGVGDPDVNLLLSQERAEAIVDYLVQQGVDPEVLTPRGYGASVPIADNTTEQGQAANRRVELIVVGGN